ncbi:MAG: hypothetical protein K6G06_05330 [Butyrivibrio sp.]|nr:hypothetical protein [Butyrivibrio sp.]
MSGINGIGFNASYTSGMFGPAFANGSATSAATSGESAGKVLLNPGQSVEKKPGMRSSPAECETCKNRKYQDGSNENVSFKSAQHISPEAAASRVRGHEQEHVANAYKKAAQENGKVINASVKIETSVCPECGRTYVSGGLTTTQIMYKNEDNPYSKSQKSADAASGLIGANIDYAV